MGQLISNYIRAGSVDYSNLVIDLENAQPRGEEEKELYEAISVILSQAKGIISKLENYTGCADVIRKAITTPTPEAESAAFDAVLPSVATLKEIYEYSLDLELCIPRLLAALGKDGIHLSDMQAVTKQLADLFDFSLRFDELKMTNPAIQNDFSYYRRQLNRARKDREAEKRIVVKDELANKMSLFFAYPTPMMKIISETTSKFIINGSKSANVPKENVHQVLAQMANVCVNMVEKKKFSSEETNLLCLRTMTAAIVLYDHIHPTGAFHRNSAVHIKSCIMLLKTHKPPPPESLINTLRFTTIHLTDDSTPNGIKQLLA